MNDEFLTPEETARILNVTTKTLINWEEKGKLRSLRTQGKHRRYYMSDIRKLTGEESKGKQRRICYCRVSSNGQIAELHTQADFFKKEYPTYEIIKDVGSGLNFKRKGFNALLDSAIKGDVSEVVVTYQDRLCRFGFPLIEKIIQANGGKIVVLYKEENTPEKELVNDLISIITVFSSRLYGLRSGKIKEKIKKATEEQVGRGGRAREDEDTKNEDSTD